MTERRPQFPDGGSDPRSGGARGALKWPAEAIWELVAPMYPSFSVEILPEIDSTNTELMRRAHAGQFDPVLLVAERQTAGRGRLGRTWESSNGGGMNGHFTAGSSQGALNRLAVSPDREIARPGGLTFSLGLPLAPMDWSGLSLAMGLSVVNSLHPSLQLKWPNDVWLQDRKLAGILIETASVGEVRYAVIGVGINLLLPDAAGLRTPPAALCELLPDVDAPAALARVAVALVHAVRRFETEGFAPLRQAFHARDALYGRELECSDGITGTARGVDAQGALLVHTAAGLKKITSAEVSVRPTASPPSALS